MAWDWFDRQWGSLFGGPGAPGSSTYGPPSSMAPDTSLAGLLDPAGIRQQAAWSGLGALSQGLLAAGMRRPAGSPSPLPQALGAFGPAYQGALQSGYQSAGAEQQFRQREATERTRLEREQAWQTALAAATPAERTLMQQMGPEQWAQMQGNVQAALRRPTAVGPGHSIVIPQTNQTIASVPPTPEPLQFHRNPDNTFTVIDPNQIPGGRGPPAGGQPPAVGGAQPGVTGRAPPENVGGLIVPGSGTGPSNPIRYQQFASAEEGRAAAEQQLVRNAQRISSAGQPVTLQTLIGGAPGAPYGWAPGGVHGNDPVAYVRNLSMWTGLRPDQPLDLSNPQVRQAILAGIVRQEGVATSAARGGGTRGGAQPPAADPGGATVTMTPGAIPPPAGTTTAPAGGTPPAEVQSDLAQGSALIGSMARPPQAPPAAPGTRPTAAPPAASPQQPGIRTIGTPRPVDPLDLGGNAERAQMINQYRALLRIARTRPLTDDEALALDIFRGQLEAPVQEPGGGVRMPPPLPQYPAAPGAAAVPPSPAAGAAAPPTGGAPAPAPAPVPPRERPPVAPGMIRRETPGGGYTDSPVAPVDVSAVRRFEVQSQSVLDAMNNFERLANSASNLTRFNTWARNPLSSDAAAIEQAYNNLVVTLRSEAFLNTGVLQEPERIMLQQMMRDPATTRGALTSPEARTAQFNEIREMIRNGINAQRQSIAQPPLAPAPPPPAAPARVIQYDAQGNRVRQ